MRAPHAQHASYAPVSPHQKTFDFQFPFASIRRAPSEPCRRLGKRRIDRSTSKRSSKKLQMAAITAFFLDRSLLDRALWPVMTRSMTVENNGHCCACRMPHASTAWDSEIESLTSLIKLHQNERRSAPCGQIGATTQPPVRLATSPTLKKFWVARAFEVRWACTYCHDRAGLKLLSFTTFSFQSFLCFIGSFSTTLNAHSTLAYSQHQHQATSWKHDDALVRCSHEQQ